MGTTRSTVRTLTTAALVAAVLAVTAPGAAAAAAPASSTATTTERGELLRQRAELACARVPVAVSRTENLQERLAADAATRGSLAWLEGRVEQAEERGRTEVADVLRARLAVRQELAGLLPLRLEALASAAALCDDLEDPA